MKEKLVLPIEMDVHECLTFSEKYREAVSTYNSNITTQGWYLNDGRGTIQGFICWHIYKRSYIVIINKWKVQENMTDITKYRNVSLTHDTYKKLITLSKILLPDAKLSISKTIESIANEKAKKLNGKFKKA